MTNFRRTKYLIEYYFSKLIKKLHLRAIKGCSLHPTAKVCAGSQLVNVRMGKYSDMGYDCVVVDTEIGAFCSLGSGINIGGASHSMDWVSTSPVFNANKDHIKKKFSRHEYQYSLTTKIGSDVWIGDKAMIKAGLSIGDGVVIGMGSVVTKNIPSYEIWAGNPAKMIRKRFSEDVIEYLTKMKWWDLDDREIQILAKNINNIQEFLKENLK